jgi:Flp pilus assembly protein TadG
MMAELRRSFWARARDQRGAVYVEFIVAIVPMLVVFWGLLQVNGLLLADLVVRNAAMNAVRAAIVCDSDETTSGPGAAHDCAQQAAEDTTKAVKSIQSVGVQVDGASSSGSAPVTATVSASYECQVPLVASLACGVFGGLGGGTGTATIERSATLPNQGHYYQF